MPVPVISQLSSWYGLCARVRQCQIPDIPSPRSQSSELRDGLNRGSRSLAWARGEEVGGRSPVRRVGGHGQRVQRHAEPCGLDGLDRLRRGTTARVRRRHTRPRRRSAFPRPRHRRPSTASTTPSRPRSSSTPAPTTSRSLKSLEDYGNWLGAHHPDPRTRSTTVAAPDSPGTRATSTTSRTLRDHTSASSKRLDSAEHCHDRRARPRTRSRARSSSISLAQSSYSNGPATSARASRSPGRRPTSTLVVLVHGRWYLAASDDRHRPDVHL